MDRVLSIWSEIWGINFVEAVLVVNVVASKTTGDLFLHEQVILANRTAMDRLQDSCSGIWGMGSSKFGWARS
jgi:hypothetical protein